MPKHTISAEEARQLLNYDPETGTFTWRVGRGSARAGSAAGTPKGNGYAVIKIYGKNYSAHRLAWLLTHGVWPENQIDHINGRRDDNRLCNLRLATWSENNRNAKRRSDNTSGVKGVSFDKARDRWLARIKTDGYDRYLGRFDTPEEAHAAYCKAAAELHGEFANFG